MQTTLKTRNGPDACRQCKAKLPDSGHCKIRCESCLEKQRAGVAEAHRRRKFEELENVPPDDREVVKKPNLIKVRVNEESVIKCDTYGAGGC